MDHTVRGRLIAAFVVVRFVILAAPVRAADLDLVAGVLSYTEGANEAVANDLSIALAAGTYTIGDPAETMVALGAGALAAHCVAVEATTITCPAAAIAAFVVATGNENDTIDLSGVTLPAVLRGGRGNDVIMGGAGDDSVFWTPGDGDDLIDGGPGDDTLDFAGSNGPEHFTVTVDGDGFRLTRDVANVTMRVTDAEVLVLRTSTGADMVATTGLVGTRQVLTNTAEEDALDTLTVDARGLCVLQLADTITVAGRAPIQFAKFANVVLADAVCPVDPCAGAVATLGCTVNGVRNQLCQGTDRADVIVGTAKNDVILGGGGNDRIRAGQGDDLVCGEDGADLVDGGPGNDTLVGGPGADRLRGDAGDDTLIGGDDADDLVGGRGADRLVGGSGDDRLRGGAGPDTLRGDDGVDVIDGGGVGDQCADSDQPGPFARCELP